MEPNQNVPDLTQPVPTEPVQQPVVSQPQPQVYAAPIQQPVMEPVQPVMQPTPQAFAPAPAVQPVVQPQPMATSAVFGSSPQLVFTQPVVNNMPYQPKKSKVKLFIILGVVIAALVGIGITVWLLFFSNNISLTEYSNSDYSILVPSSYKKTETGSNVSFDKPDTKAGFESKVAVSVTPVPEGYKQQFIDAMDQAFTEKAFSSGSQLTSFQDTSNVKVEKSTKNGMDYRLASGNIVVDKVVAGSFKVAIFISDTKAYTVGVMAHSSEPGLAANASKIVDSFKAK